MAINGISASGLASPGIGSGLDVNSIVSKLMAAEQRPLTLLSQRETGYQNKLGAFNALKGSLASFQGSMQSLSTAARFQPMTASAGDATILSASATSSASPGTFSISVDHLAQSQVLAAGGIAATDTASSTGTLTIQVGAGNAKTITIDGANNTLAGLRDAINAANAGVDASIINVGGSNPYKLVLTAAASGAANTISITNNLAAGELRDTVASFTEARQALDAALTVNGVAVASASNTLAGAIPGVTLNLLKGGDSTLTIARDSAGVQAAVGAFVKSYNDLNGMLRALSSYNPTTKQAGALLGDSSVQKLQSDVRAIVGSVVNNTGGGLSTLSQIGVAFQKDGSLALDSAKLTSAVTNNFADLASLFAVQGRTANALLSYVGSSTSTQAGTYQVSITAAATRGTVTAANAVAGSTVIDASNDGVAIRIDGTASGTLTLTHGTYTASQLAQALESAINSATEFTTAGITATVSVDAGKLVVTSNAYGADSRVSGATGTALTALGFDGSESGTGNNVAASLLLNGASISASGSGQTLSGLAGSAAEGLTLRYTGTPAQAATTPNITFNLSTGIASRLQRLAADMLDGNGVLAARTGGLNTSIKDIGVRRDAVTNRLTQVEANYRAQFNALDTLVSKLNQTSSFLTQQLANLSKSNGN